MRETPTRYYDSYRSLSLRFTELLDTWDETENPAPLPGVKTTMLEFDIGNEELGVSNFSLSRLFIPRFDWEQIHEENIKFRPTCTHWSGVLGVDLSNEQRMSENHSWALNAENLSKFRCVYSNRKNSDDALGNSALGNQRQQHDTDILKFDISIQNPSVNVLSENNQSFINSGSVQAGIDTGNRLITPGQYGTTMASYKYLAQRSLTNRTLL